MARKLRIHVPGGFYHVTLRGNHRQPVFFGDSDRALLDSIVAKVVDGTGARIHAYCWMTNHLHLLVQVHDIPLGRLILRIAGQYARAVQAGLSTTGHLFERRYHCTLVDADNYLLTLIRYIHLNPVRGGLVPDARLYKWSSHRNYLDGSGPDWVTTCFALGVLGSTRESALANYRTLMSAECEDRWGEGRLQPNANFRDVLGDDEFAERTGKTVWLPRSTKSLGSLMDECSSRFGVSKQQLASPAKAHVLAVARAWLAHEAVVGRVASVSETARQLARTEGSLRQLMTRYPRRNDAKS